jgi:hypothetical protein
MTGLFHFVLAIPASPFKSKLRLEAENAMLRHQLMVLRRRVRGRVHNVRFCYGRFWRKAAAHGHVRSGGAGSTGVRNTGVKSLAGGANCKVSGFFSAKSVAEFETFVSVACFAAWVC